MCCVTARPPIPSSRIQFIRYSKSNEMQEETLKNRCLPLLSLSDIQNSPMILCLLFTFGTVGCSKSVHHSAVHVFNELTQEISLHSQVKGSFHSASLWKKLPVLKTAAGWSQLLTDVQVLSYSISTWLSTKLHTIVFNYYLHVIQVKNNRQWQ